VQSRWQDDAALRRLAEDAVAARERPPDSGLDRDVLVNELLVYRTELEMQNEALREAHHELAKTEEHYRDLFENAPVGYLLVDGQGKITQANARSGEILGRMPKALTGVRFSQFLSVEEAVTFERHRREVLRAPGVLVAEFTLNGPDGRRKEVRLESCRIGAGQGAWRVAMTDVTGSNRIARKLSHSERLAAIGRHASNIAHDVNNFLFSICGHAEAALRALRPEDPAYAAVARLNTVAERCSEAVEQFAAFSRSEPDQAPIVNLNTRIEELASMIRPLLGEGVELELQLTASDADVRLSPGHVEQILLSTLRNANQAMPHGGTFRIETASVELAGATQQRGLISARCVRWTITDTGVGMNESTRRQAFEPFFTTKPAGVGTGLGLAMIGAIVDRAGGVVALESQVGRGTSVIIHLPRATGFTSTAPQPLEEEYSKPSSTVMVVEDDFEARTIVADHLRSAGCEVIVAASGIEALELLRRLDERVSLVLIDSNLPGAAMDELLRAIRALSAGVEVLVTPLTGTHFEDPSPDDIARTVRRVLNGIRFAGE
jgi:PAS domain S-box-containing protein